MFYIMGPSKKLCVFVVNSVSKCWYKENCPNKIKVTLIHKKFRQNKMLFSFLN